MIVTSRQAHFSLVGLPTIFLALLFVWPLLYVVSTAIYDHGLTLGPFRGIVESEAHIRVIVNTLRISAIVTVVCLLLGYPIAFYISNSSGLTRQITLALVVIPFCTSVVIRAYAWIALFQRYGFINKSLLDLGLIGNPLSILQTETAVIIGMAHAVLPFAIFPILNSLDRIDRTLIRASETLGASEVRTFVSVWIPLSLPGIMAGGLLTFITSVGFYVTPALLGGRQQVMVSVLIEQYINRTANWPAASALGTVLLVITSILYLAYERVARKSGGFGGN